MDYLRFAIAARRRLPLSVGRHSVDRVIRSKTMSELVAFQSVRDINVNLILYGAIKAAFPSLLFAFPGAIEQAFGVPSEAIRYHVCIVRCVAVCFFRGERCSSQRVRR